MKEQETNYLFEGYDMGSIHLKNRMVMTSLTRARADNDALAPNAMMVEYYASRASAGLIITESAWVSKGAVCFINIPGIFSKEQVDGWKKITDAVHNKDGKIFVQLVHSGSAAHPDFQNGNLPMGPSAINQDEKVYTANGFADTVTPREMTQEDISSLINEYRIAAKNAINAGFDGIEIHAQINMLLPQFLSAFTNTRTDAYGGSIENRARLFFEIIDAVKEIVGNRVGVKFTPFFKGQGKLQPDAESLALYEYIFNRLNDVDIAYVQLVGPDADMKGTSMEKASHDPYAYFRKIYKGTLMVNRGFTAQTANDVLKNGNADLVAFGIPFIANPDLAERFQSGIALNVPDAATFYSPGEKGYIDYPMVAVNN